MQIYLVGGAVRDRLLGLPVRERDWVVVGAKPGELEELGYRKVGRSFPVYLHPDSGEEYALARTETKTGPGYHGFEVHADENVTLEDDLERRDITINAMAQGDDGTLIDPWGGRRDLDRRVLRHVGDAFAEDPVRILRVARFAARFHELGFQVASETLALMRGMVDAGEVDSLVPERVWRETESALGEPRPDVFFRTLRSVDALAAVYPELDALFGVPQPERWHPEIDTGEHVMLALREAARRARSPEVRFAALMHDLGKGTTPQAEWPKHVGHESRSVRLAEQVCERLAIPNRFRELAVQVARHHGNAHRAFELKPATVLRMLEAVDAFRRPERFEDFLAACEADACGRKGRGDAPYPQAAYLRTLRDAATAVDAESIARGDLDGKEIGAALQRARTEAISDARADARVAARASTET